MKNLLPKLCLAAIIAAAGISCTQNKKPEAKATNETTDNVPSDSLRQAYYGDLHTHTSFSFDAYVMFATHAVPNDAYRFAQGETVTLNGKEYKRRYPLDFMAVTDHSENIGLIATIQDTASALYKSDIGRQYRKGGNGMEFIFQILKAFHNPKSLTDQGINVDKIVKSQWQKEISAANDNYKPGKFTTFVGYEWSSHTNFINLHRNVIFKGAAPDKPFTSIDSDKPEDLWAALTNFRKKGFEALAISHNANVSNGMMFDWKNSYGKPIDEAYAQTRAFNEPLSEITQGKGQSDTHPSISSNDEFANYEIFNYLLGTNTKGKTDGSYIRQAYGRGLEIQKRIGINPFKFGVTGSSDYHNGLQTSDESAYGGNVDGQNNDNGNLTKDAVQKLFAHDNDKGTGLQMLLTGSAGLTGVWAEKNTRESIYNALRRKETFATTGTRIKFRFFAGWDYDQDLLKQKDWIKSAYAKGVPMGADLPEKPAEAKAPKFAVWAIKDPDGANLDRVQVIKVWLDKTNKYQEKVFDVAASNGRKPDANGKIKPVGNTVDLKTGKYENTIGDTELSAVWQDPEFDAAQSAVYYLRVLEIPTPRWSTLVAIKAGVPLPKIVSPTIQERGWASPIWYNPK